MLKEAWFFHDGFDDGTGVAIIAQCFDDARRIAIQRMGDLSDEVEDPYEILGVDVDDLPCGVVDPFIGLERGMYSWIEDTCPICGSKFKKLRISEEILGLISCSDCEEEQIDKAIEAGAQAGEAEAVGHPQ